MSSIVRWDDTVLICVKQNVNMEIIADSGP